MYTTIFTLNKLFVTSFDFINKSKKNKIKLYLLKVINIALPFTERSP